MSTVNRPYPATVRLDNTSTTETSSEKKTASSSLSLLRCLKWLCNSVINLVRKTPSEEKAKPGNFSFACTGLNQTSPAFKNPDANKWFDNTQWNYHIPRAHLSQLPDVYKTPLVSLHSQTPAFDTTRIERPRNALSFESVAYRYEPPVDYDDAMDNLSAGNNHFHPSQTLGYGRSSPPREPAVDYDDTVSNVSARNYTIDPNRLPANLSVAPFDYASLNVASEFKYVRFDNSLPRPALKTFSRPPMPLAENSHANTIAVDAPTIDPQYTEPPIDYDMDADPEAFAPDTSAINVSRKDMGRTRF